MLTIAQCEPLLFLFAWHALIVVRLVHSDANVTVFVNVSLVIVGLIVTAKNHLVGRMACKTVKADVPAMLDLLVQNVIVKFAPNLAMLQEPLVAVVMTLVSASQDSLELYVRRRRAQMLA